MNQLVLRPLSIGDLFDEVFSLYRGNFLLIVGVSAVVYIPFSILLLLVVSPIPTEPTPDQALGMLGPLFLTLILFLVAVYPSQAALTKAVAERYLGHPTSIASAYGFVLQRFFPFLGTLILLGLAFVGVGVLALIVGFVNLALMALTLLAAVVLWIIMFFWFAFVFPVFVVENRAYGDAMRRSRELAKGNWGRIFLLALLTAVLNWVLGLAIGALSGMLFGENPMGIQAVLAGLIEGIGNALMLPIGLIAFVLLYFDIRVRKEGFDLQILAQEMAARAGGMPTPPSPPPP